MPTVDDWQWTEMGEPEGVNIVAPMGAVTVMDTPSSPQRAHFFVQGNDRNTWCRWSDGQAWHWTNMGKPSVNIAASMGAVTVMDTPISPQRAHVFVRGEDSNIWCLWSSGTAWQWTSLGKPPPNIVEFMGMVTVMDNPSSPQRAHVFVKGEDSNMWCLWSSGTAWQWTSLGKPRDTNIVEFMGAVTVKDTPASPQRAHVFVKGEDTNMWCLWSSGTAWQWTNMSKPSGVNMAAPMGAVAVADTPTSAERAHVFVRGDDSNVWCRWSDGTAWHWTNTTMSNPTGVDLRVFTGAATGMDTPTSSQQGIILQGIILQGIILQGVDCKIWCRWPSGS